VRQPFQPAAEGLVPSPGSTRTTAPVELQPLRPYTDWSLPETAADALGRIGPAAVPDLVRELASSSPERRWRAARVLGRIGPDAAIAVPELVRLLRDPDERVRLAAARTLGQIGPNAASAVPELIQLLDEPPVDR
jgi:HEAT repeat protein